MKLLDHQAYQLLKRNGIRTAEYKLVKSLEQAKKIAKKIKIPLVMKIDADIIHKKRHGCVEIVFDEKEIPQSYKKIMKNAKKQTKNIYGMIIQEYLHGFELIIGSEKDKQFGQVLMFGIGGPFTEVIQDVSFRKIPLSKKDASDIISDTKISEIIKSQNSKKIKEIEKIILKVSKLLEKNPEIQELDINPLFLDSLKAADVRIIK